MGDMASLNLNITSNRISNNALQDHLMMVAEANDISLYNSSGEKLTISGNAITDAVNTHRTAANAHPMLFNGTKDFNNITDSGFYYHSTPGVSNAPVGEGTYFLIVSKYETDDGYTRIMQIAFPRQPDALPWMYIRQASKGAGESTLVWNEWLRLAGGRTSAQTNGYTLMPNGILLQWGETTPTVSGGSITDNTWNSNKQVFPIAFPVACLSLTATRKQVVVSEGVLENSATITRFDRTHYFIQDCASANRPFSWIAIGY